MKRSSDTTIDWIDWSCGLIGVGFGAGLVVYGIGGTLGMRAQIGFSAAGTPSALFILSIVFGGMLLSYSVADVRRFICPPDDEHSWWYTHMIRMLGGYVATVTAFTVANAGPVAVTGVQVGGVGWADGSGNTVIASWVAYYRHKFDPRPSDAHV